MKINADRALVIHPVFKSRVSSKNFNLGSFEEAIALSKSLGLKVISKQIIKINSIRAGYFFGSGTIKKI